MKIPIQHLLSAFLLLATPACRKSADNSEALPHYLIPQEAKDYVYFLPGTYWIYKDSASGIEDSVYAYYAQDVIDTLEPGNIYLLEPAIYEGLETYYFCTYNDYTYHTYGNTTFDSYQGSPRRHKTQYSKFIPGDYIGETTLMEYPIVEGNFLYANDGYIETKAFFPTYDLNGHSFYNVVKLYNSENTIYGGSRTNFYISKNIGIIRKEITDSNQVWNLSRYNIVQ